MNKKGIVIIAIALAVGFFSWPLFINRFDLFQFKSEKSAHTALLQDRLVALSELAVLKYEYRNVITSWQDQTLSLPGLSDISYAETIKLITYSGYLKAGTDLSKAVTDYDAASKTITVRLPASRVLDNVVETEATRVEDVKGNLFSKYPTQTVFDEINADKKKLQEDKIRSGFLKEADERIRQVLTAFLKSRDYETIVVEFSQ